MLTSSVPHNKVICLISINSQLEPTFGYDQKKSDTCRYRFYKLILCASYLKISANFLLYSPSLSFLATFLNASTVNSTSFKV